MISYKIERVNEPFMTRWVVIAMFGNGLEWEVARYDSQSRAQDRVSRMEEMRKAQAQ